MTSLETIENKISSVKKYLNFLNAYKKLSMEDIKNDMTVKGALERYLYLAVQATIELAEAIISYNNFRKPSVLSESFHILNEEGVVPPELTDKLVKMVGFRNIIAHDYEDLNYDIVLKVLHSGLSDIEEFLTIASGLNNT